MLRKLTGWLALGVSLSLGCFWALWGAVENFHEGWYFESFWKNAALAVGQYYVPFLGFWGLALVALRWPVAGAALHLALGAGVLALFGPLRKGAWYLWPPLLVLAVIYFWTRPEVKGWWRRALVWLPPLTLVGYSIGPGYLALTRVPLESYGKAEFAGLTWAPAGPGWPQKLGGPWREAERACALLSADGSRLETVAGHHWRLPTDSELKRALVRHAVFPSVTTKSAPLWNRHSQIIYLWAAGHPQYVSYNGWHHQTTYADRRGYIGWRCVQ